MTFVAPAPNQTYHPRVYAAFGSTIDDDPATWVWTDITKYVRPGLQPVALSGGRSALSGTADPSQITLMLDNTDGRFTARSLLLRNGSVNPYWPNVVRNTPLKVTITWDRAVAEYELLTAFVDGWPLQPNAGLINVSVPIAASGRLRRLRRTTKQIRSALFRAHRATGYDSYWPMEDLAGSTRFVHGPTRFGPSNVTHPLLSMRLTGAKRPALASNTSVPGSAALPDFSNGAHATATVTRLQTHQGFTVDYTLFVGDTISGSGTVPLTRIFYQDGSWLISLDLSNQRWQLDWIDPVGQVSNVNNATFATTVNPFDGLPHMVRFFQDFVGAIPTIQGHLWVDNQDVTDGLAQSQNTSNANVSTVGIAGTATGFPLVIGHLAATNDNGLADMTNIMNGYTGETASDRVIRLCGEENIPLVTLTGTVPSVPMGPQTVDTVGNLLDDCADIDNGLLHDAGSNGGLVYASGAYRYNAAVTQILDYTQHQIGDGLVTTYDDQDLVSEWTVIRNNGSSATIVSTNSTDGYALQATVNAATDGQLDDIAGWRVHLGTYDAYRLPSIRINMRTTPELAQFATSLQMPARISPINIPSPYPQESLDQFVEGFLTSIDSTIWMSDFSCTPYMPWRVFVVGTNRLDTSGSTLASSASLGATSLSVATTGVLWTTNGGDMPLDILVGGTKVHVTAISGTSSPQTFTISALSMGRPSGSSVSLFQPAYLAL